MTQLSYLAVLAFIVAVTLPLEFLFGARVWRRPKRLALTLLPVLVVFIAWDIYAISAGHWDFDPEQTTGVTVGGGVPIEEVLFFIVVPIASILTLETVGIVSGRRVIAPGPAIDSDDVQGQPTREPGTEPTGAA